jgi:HSP20 family protein
MMHVNWLPVRSGFNPFFDWEEEEKRTKNAQVPVEIVETDKALMISLDIPGVRKEDFSLEIKNNELLLSWSRKSVEIKDGKLIRSEKAYGDFRKSFKLADQIDQDKIQARFEAGVLVIALPKMEKATRKIEIES